VAGAGLSLGAAALGITGYGALAAGIAGAACGFGVEQWMTRKPA
jgi:hypothetical protein